MLESVTGLALVLLTNALGMFSPGPDMFLLIRNSTRYSVAAGYWTVFGITTGITIHIVFSLLGITGLALQNQAIFRGFLILAGVYLLYSGSRGLFPSRGNRPAQPGNELDFENQIEASSVFRNGRLAAFREGLLCNLLNIKAAAFFVSLFGLVIGPETPAGERITLGILCVIECLILWSLFVWFLRKGVARPGLPGLLAGLTKVFSVLLILVGLLLIYEGVLTNKVAPGTEPAQSNST